MLLRKVLSLTCELKSFSKDLWAFLCIIVSITTIVMVSRYLCDASNLRNWRNETNDYMQISVKMSTIQKFLQFLSSSSSSNDNTSIHLNYTGMHSTIPLPQENNSDTIVFDNNDYGSYEQCKPLPPRDDFSKCGPRIADRKCCEYIWAWKYKDDLIEYSKCDPDFGIIGGRKVEQGEFPHMVAVGFSLKANRSQYGYLCGGSLISDRFVLTAAHCTALGQSDIYDLIPTVVGMESISLQEMKNVRIDKIYKHYNYASPKYDYDIALFKLFVSVVFTYSVHPACLSTDINVPYTKLNVTGWGSTNRQDLTRMSNDLQVATVNTVPHAQCSPMIRSRVSPRLLGQLREHHVCAFKTREADTCKGDSGGPLQVRINNAYGNIHRVIGVTSFGSGCATIIPGVYVKVAAVISWIERIVWPKQDENYYEGIGQTVE